ncbi:Clavaminate synthase-like protein [Aspergillus sclerotiicarbonarius CBS 121057]|uniref:Clavaminate synthase-like protein n=1 Tax=Aspergillus sclerotiicarbonarius (strain CBS 121057 / IBT 28362) TaxID=1448318 RepID=A0A319EEV1_ASPSB|nr:Clavaminate synthase-like protein [Aspergillus sclerotiicarbonarius CBS 121057]
MGLDDIPVAQAVTVSLQELIDGTVSPSTLTEAFGPSSLGIILVKDLPPNFTSLRAQVLSNASYLASLPEAELESLTSPPSKYLIGWSLGKETLRDGHFDTHKGSYYLNCAFYNNSTLQGPPASSLNDSFPEYTTPNIWPAESSLPTFRSSFEALCTVIIDTAALVARACDRFAVDHVEAYETGYLEHVVRGSVTSKARLLHYFPTSTSTTTSSEGTEKEQQQEEGSNEGEDDDDDWCATHLDHGCLTGLTSAMFIDEAAHPPNQSDKTSPLPELSSSPDPKAGLYIRSRTGQIVKVNIPKDCLAFQTGEALQLITKGQFRAVPHFVKGAKGVGRIARNTLAVFTQPNLEEEVQAGVTFGDFARGVVAKTY